MSIEKYGAVPYSVKITHLKQNRRLRKQPVAAKTRCIASV
jgi:hypothetical protein